MEVTPVPLGYNTAYLVAGGGARVLIDAGPDYAGAWEQLQGALGGRRPDLVVATHGHLDHAGLAARWQAAGVPVWLGAGDEPLAAGPQLARDEELGWFCDYVEGCGAPAAVRAAAVAELEQRREWARRAIEPGHPPAPRGGRWPTGLRYEPFVPDVVVRERQTIAGTSLEVVPCPGHTPGNLVVVDREQGWLFSGDQLLADITPTPGIQFLAAGERFRSLPAFAASLRRLADQGLQRCFPGHGAPFDGVERAVGANLRLIEERAQRVRQALASGAGPSPYGIAEAIYPRALRRRFWQIIATVQGHLDVLEERDGVRRGGRTSGGQGSARSRDR